MGRQKLINLHSSGTSEPNSSMLELGEIAVKYASEESCLYIKDNDGNLKKFIESGAVQTMIDNSDIDGGFYYTPPYLTFEAISANSTVQLNRIGTATTLQNAVLQYSTDNCKTWNDYTFTQQGTNGYSGITITLANVGDTVKFKGNNGSLGIGTSNYHIFKMEGKIKAIGDITSLNNEIGGDIPISNYCYYALFYNCSSLTTAPELPATTLSNFCYKSMFMHCTSLTTAPELPATTLANGCYSSMFNVCTSLTTAPELPATTMADSCCTEMFVGCSSLTTAPELPATTLANFCYYRMFSGCTSLTTAPELPATTLASNCYKEMFAVCRSLTTAPELPSTNLAVSCYYSMFSGCTLLTNIQSALPATTLANYCYSAMFNGCTSLTIAPNLPATSLVSNCYRYMFYGCSNLNYIKAMFTTTPSTTYTQNWVNGVASAGTFVKNTAAQWYVTGVNGVPTGWTIETASS